MLKIKDNVDLKELEKFGFIYFPEEYIKGDYMRPYYAFYGKKRFLECEVDEYTRKITSYNDDKIYDLIQAGLVEKVE